MLLKIGALKHSNKADRKWDTVEHEIHACPKYSELGSFAS